MIAWLADCKGCALAHFTPLSQAAVVRSFPTHVERDQWRREHMAATGHWVGTRILEYEESLT